MSEMEWQPIESAPKGRDDPILGYCANIGWQYFVMKWIDRDGGFWCLLDSDYQPFWGGPEKAPVYPTHWQPLPEKPLC